MEMQLVDINDLAPSIRAKVAKNEAKEWAQSMKEWEKAQARKARHEEARESED
jgi:hypothetical protein